MRSKMEKCLSVLKNSKSDNEKFAALLLVSGVIAWQILARSGYCLNLPRVRSCRLRSRSSPTRLTLLTGEGYSTAWGSRSSTVC